MFLIPSLESTLKRFGVEVAENVVKICAEKYGFEEAEALSLLGEPSLVHKPKEVKERQREAKVFRSAFPLPYNGEYDSEKCHALRQNQGLYTQCQLSKTNEKYCNQCHKLSKKSESGIPEYGTIESRKAAYDSNEEFVSPTGRKVTPYYKIMNKYQVTQETVESEAAKVGITVNPIHYEVLAPKGGRRRLPAEEKAEKEPKGSKGRPKKEKKVIQIEGDDDDLFAALVASANSDDDDKVSEEKAAKEAKRAQEKADREAKLAAEKEAKEAKRAQEKADREAKLAAEKEAKEAREAKRLQDKAEREAKLAQEKAEKEAKEAKRLQEKAEKEAKLAAEKAEKEAKKKAEKDSKKSSSSEDEEEEAEVVKKITFNDKKYLLSKKSGVVYDYDIYIAKQEQVVIGKWNAAEQKVEFNSSEESEDEYESDDE
jgi:hypothetical protein